MLVRGFDPRANDADTRVGIASCVHRLAVQEDGRGFAAPEISSLQGFAATASDPEVQAKVRQILVALGLL